MQKQFKNDDERLAYQVAENTPRERHYYLCPASGVGKVVTDENTHLCDCSILAMAQYTIGYKGE